MIFVRINVNTGEIIAYPQYEGHIQIAHPELQFPIAIHHPVIPNEFQPVILTVEPEAISYHHKVMEVYPVLNNGIYTQNFINVELTNEELLAKKDAYSVTARAERDTRLVASDTKVLPDMWDYYTAQQKLEWKDYRQALRDVPELKGFPFEFEWPISPTAFRVTGV